MNLRPVVLRLAWADLHAERVRTIVDEYLGRPPFVITRLPDDARRRVIYRAERTDEPPVEIALELSDTLHQLRSTLDNLVGAIRTGGPTERSAFVITTDPQYFEARLGDRLEGVPTWAVDRFRDLQPFPDNPLRWVGDQVLLLHDLARGDRHRALMVHAPLVKTDFVVVRDPGTGENAIFRRIGQSIAEVEYPIDADVEPSFVGKLLIEAPSAAAGQEVLPLVESLRARVRFVVESIADAARHEGQPDAQSDA